MWKHVFIINNMLFFIYFLLYILGQAQRTQCVRTSVPLSPLNFRDIEILRGITQGGAMKILNFSEQESNPLLLRLQSDVVPLRRNGLNMLLQKYKINVLAKLSHHVQNYPQSISRTAFFSASRCIQHIEGQAEGVVVLRHSAEF